MVKFYVYTTVSSKKIRNKLPKFESTKYRESYKYYKSAVQQNKENIFYPLKYKSDVKSTSLQKYFIVFVKEVDGVNTIIKSSEFLLEETFYVYGLKKRLTFLELFEYILNKFKQSFTKIQRYKNKIVFQDGEQIECVLTKNLSECKRLYFKLKELSIKNKIIAFLFLGHIPSRPKHILQNTKKKLVDFTGLSPVQFSRNNTRH